MRIAFYAPVELTGPAQSPGNQRIAGLFLRALQSAGFDVDFASAPGNVHETGAPSVLRAFPDQPQTTVPKILAGYQALPAEQQPRAWFTCHSCDNALDHIGPAICEALNIPYFVAIASNTPNPSSFPRHRRLLHSLKQASAVFTLNPQDKEWITPILNEPGRVVEMPPFLDLEVQPVTGRHHRKQRLAHSLKIDPDRYWLLCVAMMRDDDELASYAYLAQALDYVQRSDWSMLIVGDGAAQGRVREMFRFENARRIHFLGRRSDQTTRSLMAAADLLVWPTINADIGMVALESLACGLPVIVGKSSGIEQIVNDSKTGVLVDAESTRGIARAIEELLDNPGRLAAMSRASLETFNLNHCLNSAAQRLGTIINPLIAQDP